MIGWQAEACCCSRCWVWTAAAVAGVVVAVGMAAVHDAHAVRALVVHVWRRKAVGMAAGYYVVAAAVSLW